MMIDIAEKDLNIKIRKSLARTIENYAQKRERTVIFSCLLFGITPQGYYKRKSAPIRKQAVAKHVMDCVMNVRCQMPRLGTRKLHHLIGADIGIGRDKLFAILRSNNLLVKTKRNYRTTTDSKHLFRRHKNLIASLPITCPDQVWVSDITYVGSRNRHTYLSLVTDAYSKKIVGYDLSQSLSASGSVRDLRMALRGRKSDSELIHHSDRGIQYCCGAYQKILHKKGIIVSMTESYYLII